MQQKPLVFIATPCFGGLVSQHYMQSVIGLIYGAGAAGFDATLALLGHDSLITRSRNTLLAQFLSVPEATHILFIDADIRFDAAQVVAMMAFDQDFVAGIYPLKVIDWDAGAIARAAGGETLAQAPLRYVGTLCPEGEIERRGRFATGVYCGGGFMLLKRTAVLKMVEAYPETRYGRVHAFGNAAVETNYALFECAIDRETGTYVSEDYGFCQRWRDIGGTIWLDTEGSLTHVGAYNFVGAPQGRYGAPAPTILPLARAG